MTISNINKENFDYLYSYYLDKGLNNKDIAKTISSFANSDGGNIIYGILEEGHKPVEINPMGPKDL